MIASGLLPLILSWSCPSVASAAASAAPRRGQRALGGRRAREGSGPGLGADPEEAAGPPLDGVRVRSDSNGYGFDIQEGV